MDALMERSEMPSKPKDQKQHHWSRFLLFYVYAKTFFFEIAKADPRSDLEGHPPLKLSKIRILGDVPGIYNVHISWSILMSQSFTFFTQVWKTDITSTSLSNMYIVTEDLHRYSELIFSIEFLENCLLTLPSFHFFPSPKLCFNFLLDSIILLKKIHLFQKLENWTGLIFNQRIFNIRALFITKSKCVVFSALQRIAEYWPRLFGYPAGQMCLHVHEFFDFRIVVSVIGDKNQESYA